MYKELIKDYFSFSKKERIAVIVLLLLIFALFLLPHLITKKEPPLEITALENGQTEMRMFRKEKDSVYSNKDVVSRTYEPRENKTNRVYVQGEVFYFDPNTLSFAGWKKLGLPDKTIRTIQNYLAKGGRFRHKEDIAKIYGLHKQEADRLVPYVRLNPETAFTDRGKQYAGTRDFKPYPLVKKAAYPNETIDLNTTDTSALIALPGIGSKLAARILLFRQKLGGLYEVDQLKEIYGLPDSTFQRIKARLFVSSEGLKKININTADVEVLKIHPYIRWNMANAIVQYRLQHGDFSSVEDIGKIGIVTPETQKS